MDQLIVGSNDCQFLDVCDAIATSDSIRVLYKDWTRLARKLHVSEDIILQLEYKLQTSQCVYHSVLYEILLSWRGIVADNAKLSALISALQSCSFQDAADKLRLRYRSIARSLCPSRFIRCLESVDEFLKSSGTKANVMVLFTPDPQISYSRITETVDDSISNLLLDVDFKRPFGPFAHKVIIIQTTDVEELLKKCMNLATANKIIILAHGSQIPSKLSMTHIKIDKENLSWTDLSVQFQEQLFNKSPLISSLSKQDRERIISNDILFNLIQNPEFSFLLNTVPDPIAYYINRKTLSRSTVSHGIFNNVTSHVYVLTGMEKHEVSRLANGNKIDVSRNQIMQESITAQYILLEMKTDFEEIVARTPKPVHWLHLENNKLIWRKSAGGLHEIQKFITEKQTEYTETEFFQHIENKQSVSTEILPVILSDTPGMGKSVLLANIGRHLAMKNKVVIFIVVSELIQRFEFKNDVNTESIAVAICMTACQKHKHEHKCILRFLLESGNESVQLLFDGLDETPNNDLSKLFGIFKEIRKSFLSARIWVTTRPHLLFQVENELNVLGYNIFPFSTQDSINFLVSFWLSNLRIDIIHIDRNKLSSFGSSCIEMLKSTLEDEKESISGAPLQCLLIAKVYEAEAIKFATKYNLVSNSYFPKLNISSVTDLYENMIAKSFLKYFTNYRQVEDNIETDDLMNVHAYVAIQLIFPEWADKLKVHFTFTEKVMDEVLKVGILVSTNSVPTHRFIHRTFAEYFVAWFVTRELKNGVKIPIWEYMLASLFHTNRSEVVVSKLGHCRLQAHTFNHKVICHFVDIMIGNMKFINKLSCSFNLQLEIVQQLVLSCCLQDLFQIFLLFEKLCIHSSNAKELFSDELMFLLVQHGKLGFLEHIFDRFIKNTGRQLNAIVDKSESHFAVVERFGKRSTKISLLHVAVTRGDYIIVERLLHKYTFGRNVEFSRNTFLLHHCVSLSKLDNDQVVEDKLQILKALYSLNNYMIDESCEQMTPLMCDRVHLRLLIALIELDCDVFHQDDLGDTILHKASEYLSVSEYFDLACAIPIASLRQLLCIKGCYGYTPLHKLVSFSDEIDERTLKLFIESGASLASVDDISNTILATAITLKRYRTLNLLEKYDIDLNVANQFNEGLLHNAALHGNTVAVNWLLQHEVNPNARDENGNTPTHLAVCRDGYGSEFGLSMFEIIKLQVEAGADLNARNNENYTPLEFALAKNFYLVGLEAFEAMLLNGAVMNKSTASQLFFRIMTEKKQLDDSRYRILARKCLEYGAEVNVSYFTRDATLLHDAAEMSCVRGSKFLIENLANINAKDRDGNTPLHVAVKPILTIHNDIKSSVKFVQLLVQKGSDLFALNNIGLNPLQYAIRDDPYERYHNLPVVKYLYQLEEYDALCKHEVLVILAVETACPDKVTFVCEWYGTKGGLKEIGIESPEQSLLHVSLRRENPHDVMQYLLEVHDFNASLQEPRMRNLVHILVQRTKNVRHGIRTLELLCKYDPYLLNERDNDGQIPLVSGKVDLKYLLWMLENGANKNSVNKDGKDVKQLAEGYLSPSEYKILNDALQKYV